MNQCAACQSEIVDTFCLHCCACNSFYHSLCINVAPSNYKKLSAEVKENWLCPECRNKKPRTDNKNTPVRPSTPVNNESHHNVTVRRKEIKSSSEMPARPGTPPSKSNDIFTCSRTDLRDIMRDEIRGIMKECINDLKNDINRQLKAFGEDIGSLTESINFMNESFEKLNADVKTCKNKIETISKENEVLRHDLNAITNRFNQLEQISRASNLEIQCVPERKSENLMTIVTKLAKTISCPINESDIFYCSRVAKKDPNSPRTRSILIKLNSPRSRDTFLAAAIKYNKCHPHAKLNSEHLGLHMEKKVDIYVAENLSPQNKVLHAAARKRAKELQYKYVWIRGGRIYMRKTETSEYVFVRDLSTLEKLL